METLEQSVMKISCDPGALTDPCIEGHLELMTQLAETPPIGRPQQRHNKHGAKNAKPRRTPPWGRDDNDQRHSVLIPYAIAVRSLNAEYISSRVHVGVGGEPLFAVDFIPGAVKVFKLISIVVLLRIGVTQRSEFKVKHISAVRES